MSKDGKQNDAKKYIILLKAKLITMISNTAKCIKFDFYLQDDQFIGSYTGATVQYHTRKHTIEKYTHIHPHTYTHNKKKQNSSNHSWSPSAWCCVCPKGLKGSVFACWTIVKSPTDMSSLLLCWAVLFSAGGDLCEWEGNALIWWMSAYLWEYWWPMCSLVRGVIFVAKTWQQSL